MKVMVMMMMMMMMMVVVVVVMMMMMMMHGAWVCKKAGGLQLLQTFCLHFFSRSGQVMPARHWRKMNLF